MPPTYRAMKGRMASRAGCRSSVTNTLTVGAMSKFSSERPDRDAPSSSSFFSSERCPGDSRVGIQPSAISPASAVFLGPIAAR